MAKLEWFVGPTRFIFRFVVVSTKENEYAVIQKYCPVVHQTLYDCSTEYCWWRIQAAVRTRWMLHAGCWSFFFFNFISLFHPCNGSHQASDSPIQAVHTQNRFREQIPYVLWCFFACLNSRSQFNDYALCANIRNGKSKNDGKRKKGLFR